MKLAAATIMVLASVCAVGTASACELPGTDVISLKRRPVLGDEIRLASGFGMKLHPILQISRLHTGIDWIAPKGTPVVAAGAGRVQSAKMRGVYGNTVVIDHGGGWHTLYAHLSTLAVRAGDCVMADGVIGTVGATGLAVDPHLHFEVLRHNRHIDPLSVLHPADRL